MLACSWTADPALPRRRLGAALVASAIAHALLSAALAPGFAGRERPASRPDPLSLTATLVIVEPAPPQAEPAPDRKLIASPPAVREQRKSARALPPAAAETAGKEGAVDIPDLTYYGTRQLDVFPTLAGAVELRYPPGAAVGDVKGRVLLLLLIDAHGIVNDASVVDAQPAGYFEDDALRAFRSARFRPALKGGRAVRSRVVIEVNYGTEGKAP